MFPWTRRCTAHGALSIHFIREVLVQEPIQSRVTRRFRPLGAVIATSAVLVLVIQHVLVGTAIQLIARRQGFKNHGSVIVFVSAILSITRHWKRRNPRHFLPSLVRLGPPPTIETSLRQLLRRHPCSVISSPPTSPRSSTFRLSGAGGRRARCWVMIVLVVPSRFCGGRRRRHLATGIILAGWIRRRWHFHIFAFDTICCQSPRRCATGTAAAIAAAARRLTFGGSQHRDPGTRIARERCPHGAGTIVQPVHRRGCTCGGGRLRLGCWRCLWRRWFPIPFVLRLRPTVVGLGGRLIPPPRNFRRYLGQNYAAIDGMRR